MKKKRKGVRTVVALVCIFVIVGGCYGALAVGKALALRKNYFGTPSTEVFDETKVYADPNTFVIVEKDPDKEFVVLNITDTHLSDYDYRLFTGELALRDVKRLVKEVKPDLITLSGDLVCADSEYNSVRKLTETMNSFRIPWAPVFGNHDGEAKNIDKDYLAEVMIGDGYNPSKGNYCLMRKGPKNLGDKEDENDKRLGNYVILVKEKGSNKVVHSFFMMDTGRTQLTDTQVAWYSQNVGTLQKYYGDVKSTLVIHIPLAQYYYAYMEGYDTEKKEWISAYKDLGAYGDCYEDVCCNKSKFSTLSEMVKSDEYRTVREYNGNRFNTRKYEEYFLKNGVPKEDGMFVAIKSFDSTKTVVCGHDHLNCFYTPYDGVDLVYSLKNGMGSGYKVGRNGGTVLTITEGKAKVDYYYL